MRLMMFWTLTVALAATGCAGGPSALGTADETRSVPGQTKTLVLAQLNTVKSYSPWDFSNTSGGGTTLTNIHTIGLTVQDNAGNHSPRILSTMPSLSDGSISVLPNGQMVMNLQIRPDVSWQDGTPFTTDDIAFTLAMYAKRDVAPHSSAARFIEGIDVIDRHAARLTWKTTYYKALELNQSALWFFPKHLLGEALDEDYATLQQRPYFTSEYVHLGPFRLVDWDMGETQIFERYAGYFLGTPKVDQVIIKTLGSPLTVQTELLAGSIDIAAEKTLPIDAIADLTDDLSRSGEGVVLSRQDNWRYVRFQFDTTWARPVELGEDVRLRRGLMVGWDREALRELLYPKIPRSLTNGDTFMAAGDPRAAVVGEAYAPFPYDPRRAAQELANGGWVRAADGRLLNRDGQRVEIELRSSPADAKDVTVIAAGWRDLGAEVKEYVPPSALSRENAFSSQYPATETSARGTGEDVFISFDSRNSAVAENNWIGNNRGHYINPALDRVVDQINATLDIAEQARLIKQGADILVADLPVIPAYFRVSSAAIRSVVRGPIYEDLPTTRIANLIARNAHLWDKA